MALATINFVGSRETFQRSVYIVDASASMQVEEGSTTRLEMALAAANRQTRTDQPHELMIMTAGLRPKVIVPFSTNRDTWESGFESIQAIDCASDLPGAISAAVAALGDEGGSIYCFTDAHLSEALEKGLPEQIHWVKISDENRDNLGITGLNDGKPISSQSPFFVDFKNYSLRPLTFDVLVKSEEGNLLLRETIELAQQANRRFFIDPVAFKSPIEETALLAVELEVEDALALDNRVYAQLAQVDLPNIYLVSTQNTFTAALEVFANHHQYDFYQVDEGRFYALDLAPTDLFVFDGIIPESPENYRSLVLQPESNFASLRQEHGLGALPIHHPVLEEVTWELFGDPATLPSDDNPRLLPSSEQAFYDLARVANSQNHRWMVLNRDLFLAPGVPGYDQEKEQVAYKVLFNAIEFLSETQEKEMVGNAFKCGEVVSIPKWLVDENNEAYKVLLPDGSRKDLPAEKAFFIGEQCGLFQVEGANGKWRFALNLLDDQTSSLEGRTVDRVPTIALAGLEKEAERSVQHKRPRAGLLLLIMVLLGVDWAYFYFRLKRTAEQ